MDIQHVRVFLALAEEGTMAAAARRLSVTQPAVSFTLGAFERELGYPLFVRSRKGLALTSQGEALRPMAEQMLEIAQAMQSSGSRKAADRGEIRIAGRQGFVQYVLPHAISTLAKQLPGIHVVQVLTGEQEEVVDLLRSGRVDVAFAAAPNLKSIAAHVIYDDPVRIAISSESDLAKKKRITLADMAGLTYCLPTRSDRLRPSIDRFLRTLPHKPSILLETNDYSFMKRLIGQGLCSGFVYGHMLATEGDLIALDAPGFRVSRELTVLHRHDDLAPHAKRYVDALVEEIRRELEKQKRV